MRWMRWARPVEQQGVIMEEVKTKVLICQIFFFGFFFFRGRHNIKHKAERRANREKAQKKTPSA